MRLFNLSLKRLLLVVISTMVLMNCTEREHTNPLHPDFKGTASGDVIINENIVSYDSTSFKESITEITDRSISIKKNSQLSKNIENGSIIISDYDKGVSRYVVNIQDGGNAIILETRTARLDEIILKGRYTYKAIIQPDMFLDFEPSNKNVSLMKSTEGKTKIDFGSWNVGGTDDILINTEIDFGAPEVTFIIEFDYGTTYLEASLNLECTSSIKTEAKSNVYGGWQHTPPWAKISLPPIPIGSALGIPFLDIYPQLDFSLGVKASLKEAIKTEIVANTSVLAGIKYEGGISPIWEFSNSFDYNVGLIGEGEIGPYLVIPKLKFMIGKAVGPFIDEQLGIKYKMVKSSQPYHGFYGSYKANWGGEIDLFGILKLSQSFNISEKEWTIMEENITVSNHVPNKATLITPSNNSTISSVPIRFEWDGYDPDGDELTYELRIRWAQNPLYGVDIKDITNEYYNYEDDAFEDGDEYHWYIISKDPSGNTSESDRFYFVYDTDSAGPEFGTLTDSRDGRVYKTVKIGNQWWMAENFNYNSPKSVYYDNDSTTYQEYGRLYEWQEANDYAPTGWYLPTEDEWDELVVYLGGEDVAGGKMKETGLKHWEYPNTGATNESGFTAIGAGIYDNWHLNPQFFSNKIVAIFWASTVSIGGFDVSAKNVSHYDEDVSSGYYNYDNSRFYSVRYIKD